MPTTSALQSHDCGWLPWRCLSHYRLGPEWHKSITKHIAEASMQIKLVGLIRSRLVETRVQQILHRDQQIAWIQSFMKGKDSSRSHNPNFNECLSNEGDSVLPTQGTTNTKEIVQPPPFKKKDGSLAPLQRSAQLKSDFSSSSYSRNEKKKKWKRVLN